MGMLLMMTPLRWMVTGDEVAMTTHGGLTLRASVNVVVAIHMKLYDVCSYQAGRLLRFDNANGVWNREQIL